MPVRIRSGSSPAPTLSQRPNGQTASGLSSPTTGIFAAQCGRGNDCGSVQLNGVHTSWLMPEIGCAAAHAARRLLFSQARP
jgi:hypothetical protein